MNVELVSSEDKSVRVVHGDAFWVESTDNEFGTYGVLGNSFGDAKIQTDQSDVLVSDGVYREFKRQQMKLAVRATLRGLVWAFNPQTLVAQATSSLNYSF